MPAADPVDNGYGSASCFTSEIQNMMHCFGDSSQGSKETAELVESILKDQLNHIFELLCEIATNRDSTKIGIKEFLILLRRSPVKLRRFCQYLQVSDIKKTFNSGENITDTGVLNSSEPFEIHVESKQLRSALLFLWHIDPSGYLASIADPTKYCPLNDESLKERQQRMEVMTKSMDVDQYLEYSKAKQNSFKRSVPSQKFKEWFLKDQPTPVLTMTPRTWEILGYVTHETVAQIVDLSFLVRRDNTASRACDALEKNTVPVRTTRLNADLSQHSWSKAVQPLQIHEVLEAFRRFNTNNFRCSPFNQKSALHSARPQLLAL